MSAYVGRRALIELRIVFNENMTTVGEKAI